MTARQPPPLIGRPRSVSNETIFDAVSELIARKGPAGLTFAAVGGRAGLSASALAQRFGSKRGLLLAFAAHGRGFVNEAFDSAARPNRSPLRALQVALESLTNAVRTRESLANNLAFLQLDLVDPDLRAHAASQSRELRRRIRELLDRAAIGGELNEATDTAALAGVIYVTYNGALVSWAIDGAGTLGGWLRASIDAALRPYRT